MVSWPPRGGTERARSEPGWSDDAGPDETGPAVLLFAVHSDGDTRVVEARTMPEALALWSEVIAREMEREGQWRPGDPLPDAEECALITSAALIR